ncbi:helix-turn-helix domain-containing protein [Dyadobacter subterraneus]|uniref:Helix-turn-helix transcriptional regulator n=1 Tax=Dyadobacter subterraneus TaxID=2773304 RepID=A0ABR9WAW6_9BACT|nr:helix-turn-helix transcriptional regulator [Dyadobacter subterraneus]MBE9462612.1 helix-turn-helix transcriptional regulator [Dyadobacter subterraneus]
MKKSNKEFNKIDSISELHRFLGLPKPEHPLVSVVKCSDIREENGEPITNYLNGFYIISVKKDFTGKMKYGQQYYDFDEGVMSFIAPGQMISNTTTNHKGLSLIFHPDFIRNYPLAHIIKNYGFFSYSVNEALHLSEKEEIMILLLMQNIEQEYHGAIDSLTQNVIVSQIDLFLNYCNRFYNRQFITRSSVSNDLLVKLENMLTEYFDNEKLSETGPPSVQYISEQLHVSSNYLSDMLRSLTGQNTQQHIHSKLIEKAKEVLATTTLSVSEVAYQLGFEYTQSFNKLFKNKTNMSPREFRQSFN